MTWPGSTEELIREQQQLAAAAPPPWIRPAGVYPIGGCFVCSPRGKQGAGERGDRSWAAAALMAAGGRVVTTATTGRTGARYEAGLLALREGALLEEVVRRLPSPPEVLLVNATGRDHPRRAGLALHLGAVLDLPTVGVTHRPLVAAGQWPELRRGEASPLLRGEERVGHWLCTRDATRPLAVHAAWRTDPETALAVVLGATSGEARTPTPLREARRVARGNRAANASRLAPRPGDPA